MLYDARELESFKKPAQVRNCILFAGMLFRCTCSQRASHSAAVTQAARTIAARSLPHDHTTHLQLVLDRTNRVLYQQIYLNNLSVQVPLAGLRRTLYTEAHDTLHGSTRRGGDETQLCAANMQHPRHGGTDTDRATQRQ
jgi:hypothetical protein